MKQKIEDLMVKNAQLRMEKRVLEQQRESHAEHAQVLLKENSRLLDQLHMASKNRGVLSVPAASRSAQKQKPDGGCSVSDKGSEGASLGRREGKENLWRR